MIQNNSVNKIIKEMHTKLMSKHGKYRENKDEPGKIKIENLVFSSMIKNPAAGPMDCSRELRQLYGVDFPADAIINILRRQSLSNPKERVSVFNWINAMADKFVMAIYGDKNAYTDFSRLKREVPKDTYWGRNTTGDRALRMILLSVYLRHSELDQENDINIILNLGEVYAKYTLFDYEDIVGYAYHFPSAKKKVQIRREQVDVNVLLEKIGRLEDELARTNGMLQELQDDFDCQIDEAKLQELTAFFSKLNSDKYGCIIDELFSLRRGIDKLRKENFPLPIEIKGIMIMATKLLLFVKESHIDPMKKLNEVILVKVSDIENCIYEGSPFIDADEEKTVRVISPGWIYRDKGIQISRPKLKEEK